MSDPMESIFDELSAPARALSRAQAEPTSPEEKEARTRDAMATVLGHKLGLGRSLSDDELRVALAMERQRRADLQLLGGGGNSRRMIVDDGGIGLGQIDNLKQDSEYIDKILRAN